MGEYIGVTVEAGGSVTRKVWRKFMSDMEQTGFKFEIFDGHLYFSGEANYGDTSSVQDACKENGIAFKASNDAKYEISGGAEVWFPDMEAIATAVADQDGDPMLTVAELKKALEAGKTIEVLIAEHEAFGRPIPPMLIDDKPVTDEDLDDIGDDDEEPAAGPSDGGRFRITIDVEAARTALAGWSPALPAGVTQDLITVVEIDENGEEIH